MELKDLKVGMQVSITTDKDDLYGIAYRKYAGDTVTITSIAGDRIYVKENNFNWLPCQLMPITETKTDSKFVVKVNNIEEGVTEALQRHMKNTRQSKNITTQLIVVVQSAVSSSILQSRQESTKDGISKIKRQNMHVTLSVEMQEKRLPRQFMMKLLRLKSKE